MTKKEKREVEFNNIISNIKNDPEFQKRKKFRHHGKITVYEHCLKV